MNRVPYLRSRAAMTAARLLAVFAAACCTAPSFAAQPITVPFTLHGMHIYMNGAINGEPVTLVLDSGAGGNVVTPQCAKRLGLKLGGSGTAVGAGGTQTQIRATTFATLSVGEARSANQPAYVIPLPDALQCDAVLGTPFFRQWIVTIDYDAGQITLTPKGQYTKPVDAVEFHTQITMETVHIEATVDGKKGLFKIDTGAGDTLTLFGPFVEKNGMRGKYSPSFTMATGRGVGGLVYGDVVRLPSLSLGPFDLTQVAASLSRQTTGVFADATIAGNIGEAILERFKVTFDDSNNKLYLSKGVKFGTPFVGNRSGLAVDYANGVIYARSVIAGSPAAAAGIREGDAIVSVDGKPAETMKPWDLREKLESEVGTTLNLKIRTGAAPPRDAAITLRELY